jgi:hypothetical protein
MSRNPRAAILVGALTMATSTPAFSNLIGNGSFESPALPSGAVQQVTPAGWTWAGSPGFVFADAPPGSAQDGRQFVDIGNTSAFGLQQSFSVAVAGDYWLTWFDNAAAFAQVAPYRVTVSSGVADAQFDANEGVDAAWTQRSLLVALAVGDYTLAFAPLDVPFPLPAQDRLIDNVSLTAVPLPPAGWLLVAAVAPLLGRWRRGT